MNTFLAAGEGVRRNEVVERMPQFILQMRRQVTWIHTRYAIIIRVSPRLLHRQSEYMLHLMETVANEMITYGIDTLCMFATIIVGSFEHSPSRPDTDELMYSYLGSSPYVRLPYRHLWVLHTRILLINAMRLLRLSTISRVIYLW